MRKEYIIGLILLLLVGGSLLVLFFFPSSSPSKNGVSSILPGQEKKYVEITDPSGFVNTGDAPVHLSDYIGKKVILLDIMTYSCINCQRTFPYVTAWYNKYKDDGLVVIGIHTPEFAFEKDKKNVEEAMKRFGITYPVVLDNDYGTWNAYGNSFWPRKYLIDIHGNIAYDHAGEGQYEETEMKIQDLLAQRKEFLGEGSTKTDESLAASSIAETVVAAQSPETYLGSERNEYLANGLPSNEGVQQLRVPTDIEKNLLYLGGVWNIQPEYASSGNDSTITYKFKAKDVYLVADAEKKTDVEVLLDGHRVGPSDAGEDVDASGMFHVEESRLYKIIHAQEAGEHTLELRIKGRDLHAYAFTFG